MRLDSPGQSVSKLRTCVLNSLHCKEGERVTKQLGS